MGVREEGLSERCGRMGKTETGRTASCLYCSEKLEHTLALALSGVRAKVTAYGTEGVCLELVPWDLGCGRHRELSLRAGADKWRERERTNQSKQTRTPNRVGISHVTLPFIPPEPGPFTGGLRRDPTLLRTLAQRNCMMKHLSFLILRWVEFVWARVEKHCLFRGSDVKFRLFSEETMEVPFRPSILIRRIQIHGFIAESRELVYIPLR